MVVSSVTKLKILTVLAVVPVGTLAVMGFSFVMGNDLAITGGDSVVEIEEDFPNYALYGDDITGEMTVDADRWLVVDDITYTVMHSTEPQSIEITENKNQPIINDHTFEDTISASTYQEVIDDGLWNVEAEFQIDVEPLYEDFSESTAINRFTESSEHRETDFGEGYMYVDSEDYGITYRDDIEFEHGKSYTIYTELENTDHSGDTGVRIGDYSFEGTSIDSDDGRVEVELEMSPLDEQDMWDARLYVDDIEYEQKNIEIDEPVEVTSGWNHGFDRDLRFYEWEILEDNSRVTYDTVTTTEEFQINVEPSAETTIIEPQYVADLDEGFTVEVETESDREEDSFTHTELMIRDSENPSDELVRELEQVEFNDDGTPVTATLEYDVDPEEDLEGFSDDVQEFEVEAFVYWQDAGESEDIFYIDRDDGDITDDPQVGDGDETNGDDDTTNGDSDQGVTDRITGDFTAGETSGGLVLGILALLVVGGVVVVATMS